MSDMDNYYTAKEAQAFDVITRVFRKLIQKYTEIVEPHRIELAEIIVGFLKWNLVSQLKEFQGWFEEGYYFSLDQTQDKLSICKKKREVTDGEVNKEVGSD